MLEYKGGVGEGRKAWGHEDAAGIWKAKQRQSRASLRLPSGWLVKLTRVDGYSV